MSSIVIGGKTMPPVKSLTITREPIWSSNTGRCTNGEMRGDIIASKLKLQITFVPLSDEQAALLDAAITPAFFSVKFRNPGTGQTETHTMYASSPSYPVYSYVAGLPRYNGVAVNLIEK